MTAMQVHMELMAISEKGRTDLIRQQIHSFREKITLSGQAYARSNSSKMLTVINDRSCEVDLGEIDSIWKLRQAVEAVEAEFRQSSPPDEGIGLGSHVSLPRLKGSMVSLRHVPDEQQRSTEQRPKNFTRSKKGTFGIGSNVSLRTAALNPVPSSHLESKIILPKIPPEIIFAKWLLKYLDYLRELRKNFEERVYYPLVKFCYQGDSRAVSHDSVRSSGSEMLTDREGNDDLKTSSVLQLKNEFDNIEELYDYSEVEIVAARLSYLFERWGQLLDDEGLINSDLFSLGSRSLHNSTDGDRTPAHPTYSLPHLNGSPPSQGARSIVRNHEAEQYQTEVPAVANASVRDLQDCHSTTSTRSTATSRFEAFVRLIPDILVKSRSAVRLSVEWLDLDSNRRLSTELRRDKLKELQSDMNDQIDVIEHDIEEHEEEIAERRRCLDALQERETKPTELAETLDILEADADDLERRYVTVLADKEAAAVAMATASASSSSPPSSDDYKELQRTYLEKKDDLLAIESSLALLTFQRAVLEEDYELEHNASTALVRFAADYEHKIRLLGEVLANKKSLQVKIELALPVVMADFDELETMLEKETLEEGLRLQQNMAGHTESQAVVNDSQAVSA